MTRGVPLRDGRPEDVGMLPERVEAARRLCAQAVEQRRTPSLAVCAARRGTVVLHDAFGQQHPGADAPPLRRDAVFPISSLSKPITATLVMMLAEDGRLSICRPVREYLPEIGGEHADAVLVHHLLTHTSGYEEESSVVASLRELAAGRAPEMPPHAHPVHHLLLATLPVLPRLFPPGAEMVYSNVNYTLLGEIVVRVAGQPLEEFARERLFEPLGMCDTSYVLRDDQREKLVRRPADASLAQGFADGVPGLESEAWRLMPDGGGGVFSTARDVAIFGQMFLNRGCYDGERILSRLAVEEMVRDNVPGMPVKLRNMVKRHASYGYGWLVVSDEVWRYFSSAFAPRGTWWHTGAGGVQLQVDPENELVSAYMEVALDITDDLEPASWSGDRFNDVLTSAVDHPETLRGSHPATLRPGRPEDVDLRPERIEQARALLARHVREGHTPAIVALAARRGTVVLDEAHGELRPGGPALTPDAIFPITSMTKPLTATLAMILCEDGLLGVGRPAREYIPELEGENVDDVLVHHLLTHTSGWDDTMVFENVLKKIAAGSLAAPSPDEHPFHYGPLRGGLDTPRKTPPGEVMIYCNFNYTLLGEIIARVSGRPFEEFARERLFGPLGMHSTDYVLRDDMRERSLVAPPDAPLKQGVLGLPGVETLAWQRMPNGGGGAYSTTRDMAVFAQMLLSGGRYGDRRILSPPAVAEMTRNQIPGIGALFFDNRIPEGGYGYGWMTRTWVCWRRLNGLTPIDSYSHTGAGGNAFWIDPHNETIQIVFEVCMGMNPDLEPTSWIFDRFQNVVASAIDD